MPAKWTSSGGNGSFYLGHQTCVFVANNFGSLCKHGQAKWMVWIQKPLYPSSTLPHTLFCNVSPWSMDVCFIALCKVPCVLQNRTIVTATFSVNVVWDLDVFPLSLFSLGHCIVFRTGISQQSASYVWLVSALPGSSLSPVPRVCHKFKTCSF